MPLSCVCVVITRGMRAVVVRHNHTIDVGLGAFTGRPLALTGARVPAFSAALCSRWTYALTGKLNVSKPYKSAEEVLHTLAFLEIGIVGFRSGALLMKMLMCVVPAPKVFQGSS